MAYHAIEEIVKRCEKEEISFFEAIIKEDCQDRDVTRAETWAQMTRMWETMLDSSRSYEETLVSQSGLVGGTGGKMEHYVKEGKALSGPVIGEVIMRALQMGESNACMKRIVAAPTAGACGVVPAVLVTCYEKFGWSEERMVEALFVAAGIGQVIAARAYIAGASGGCQAEIGSASSMAAGALVYLKDGSSAQVADASAIALKNLLGLVCDPVAGLVEVPCVKRNVIGAVNACAAADMALAGISSTIPADQVFDAMKEVGDALPSSLKETAGGGLAASKLARQIQKVLS